MARISVGGNKRNNTGKVSEEEVERIVDMATLHAGRAASVTTGQGRWKSPDGTVYREGATFIDIVSSAKDSCDRFHNRMKKIAARAAAISDQESVLATTHCADGGHEADIVDRNGHRQMPLPTVRKEGSLEGRHRPPSPRRRRR